MTSPLIPSARHVVVPDGIVTTSWPAIRDTGVRLGLVCDPWQDGLGRLTFARLADGHYAAGVGGVVLSLPRQVGKTFFIGLSLFAVCLSRPKVSALWTSHRLRTAAETFGAMQELAARPLVAPHIEGITRANGEEAVRFTNGSRILFGARERGFGRGFASIDAVVYDEAQILSESALDDMLPATNTAADPLVFFAGTPPRPTDPAEVFTRKRAEALAGVITDTVYVEFSADADASPDDRKQWARANPSYPTRTPAASIERMRRNLSPDSFAREALGIWDAPIVAVQQPLIEMESWNARVSDAPQVIDRPAWGVKFSADGETVALSVAVQREDGTVHVEGVDHRAMSEGLGWLVDWFGARWSDAGAIIVDGRSGTGGLVRELERVGVHRSRVTVATTDQAISACAMFVSAIIEGRMTHGQDLVLARSIAAVCRRPIGRSGGWGFGSADGQPVTLAESAALAHFGASSLRDHRLVGANFL